MLQRTLLFQCARLRRGRLARWLAGRVVAEGGRPPRGDPALAAAVAYRRALDRPDGAGRLLRVPRRWPGLHAAHALGDGPCRGEVEAADPGGAARRRHRRPVRPGTPPPSASTRCCSSRSATASRTGSRPACWAWPAGGAQVLYAVAYHGGVLVYDVMRGPWRAGRCPAPAATALGAGPAPAEGPAAAVVQAACVGPAGPVGQGAGRAHRRLRAGCLRLTAV